MAVFDRTYDELLASINAFCGSALQAEEYDRIDQLINFAANRAYRATTWERFLIIGEPRSVVRGYVANTEDSFNVYGSGVAEVNGLYQLNGTANTKPRYSLYADDNTTILWDLEWDGATDWQILAGAGNSIAENTIYYNVTSATNLPPESGWLLDGGLSPAPAVKDVADIDTYLYWQDRDPISHNSRTYEFQASGYGVKPWGSQDDNGVVYVTYLKRLTDVYGNGTNGTTTAIPAEWMNYIALHASYMFLASARQSNPNGYAGVAYREVENALEDELMRLESQGMAETVRQNIATRISYSTIL